MYLVQLIYASRVVSEKMNPGTAKAIQEKASVKNKELDVTGVLFCDGNFFLQALEGARSRVSKLYNVIAEDGRHSDVTLLRFSDITVRDFPDWNMGFITYNEQRTQLLKRYSISKTFDPYTLSSESSHSLICQLAFLEGSIGAEF